MSGYERLPSHDGDDIDGFVTNPVFADTSVVEDIEAKPVIQPSVLYTPIFYTPHCRKTSRTCCLYKIFKFFFFLFLTCFFLNLVAFLCSSYPNYDENDEVVGIERDFLIYDSTENVELIDERKTLLQRENDGASVIQSETLYAVAQDGNSVMPLVQQQKQFNVETDEEDTIDILFDIVGTEQENIEDIESENLIVEEASETIFQLVQDGDEIVVHEIVISQDEDGDVVKVESGMIIDDSEVEGVYEEVDVYLPVDEEEEHPNGFRKNDVDERHHHSHHG